MNELQQGDRTGTSDVRKPGVNSTTRYNFYFL